MQRATDALLQAKCPHFRSPLPPPPAYATGTCGDPGWPDRAPVSVGPGRANYVLRQDFDPNDQLTAREKFTG